LLKPLLDPDVADIAPNTPILTGYDEERLLTYIRLLDAAAEDADWREVARIVLHIDPEPGTGAGVPVVGDPSCPRPVDDDEWLPISSCGRCATLSVAAVRHALLNQHSGLPILQLPNVLVDPDAESEVRTLMRASGEDLARCKAIGPIRQPTRTCATTKLRSSLPSI